MNKEADYFVAAAYLFRVLLERLLGCLGGYLSLGSKGKLLSSVFV